MNLICSLRLINNQMIKPFRRTRIENIAIHYHFLQVVSAGNVTSE